MKRGLKWIGLGLCGLLTLLIVASVSGYFYLASIIDQYTPRIEQAASQRLGEPVSIASTTLGWYGFGIKLVLHNVRFHSPADHSQSIHVARLRVALSPFSFIHWPHVYPSFIGIKKPQVTIRQRADGQFSIPGLPTTGQGGVTVDAIASKLDAAGTTIQVHGGTATLKAPVYKVRGWQFQHISARIEPGNTITASISADLPPALGAQFKGDVKLIRERSDGNQWRWHGRAAVSALKLANVTRFYPDTPLRPHAGAADVHVKARGISSRLTALSGTVQALANRGGSRINAALKWRNDDGGTLDLNMHDIALSLPSLFRNPIEFAKVSVPVSFQHNDNAWLVASKQARVVTPQLSATAQIKLQFPDDATAPVIDLTATARDINVESASRYLPVGIMSDEVTHWIDNAVNGGHVAKANVVFRGPVDDFPFRDGKGLFRVDFNLRNATIKFDPEWPAVHEMDASVHFKNQGLSVDVTKGRIQDLDIGGSTAHIPDLEVGVLNIQARAQGDSKQMLGLLRDSPVAAKLGSYLDELTADGPFDARVELSLPVAHIEHFTLKGHEQLKGVTIRLSDIGTSFKNMTGRIDFTQNGLIGSKDLAGQFLGKPFSAAIRPGSEDTDTTLIQAKGNTSVAALEKAFKWDTKKHLNGQFNWRANVSLPAVDSAAGAAPLTVRVRSNLKGLAIILPAPFSKPRKKTVPASVQLAILADGYTVKARYGKRVRANFRFAGRRTTASLTAGVVHFGPGKAALPTAGVLLSGRLPFIDLDKWRTSVGMQGGHNKAFPNIELDMTLAHLDVLDQSFHDVHVKGKRVGTRYRLTLAGPDVAGTIGLPATVNNKSPYKVDLDHLYLASKYARGKATLATLSPTDLPPIEFASKDTRLGDHHLGKVAFDIAKTERGIVVPRLSLTLPSLALNVYGTWAIGDNGKQYTRLAASLRSDDVKDALKALDLPNALTAESARMDAELYWLGPPNSDILKTLGGAFTVRLQNGSIPKVSPGAARLLALLSLNALPRRLLFQFGDVFGSGFSFDSIGGTFTLTTGDAYTRDFHLKSTIANVSVNGRIGLAARDYDEFVTVNTKIGSALPIAGALAGGPVTGAALLLLTEIFKHPLQKMLQFDYHVTGSWDDPHIETKDETTSPDNQTKSKS